MSMARVLPLRRESLLSNFQRRDLAERAEGVLREAVAASP